MLKNELFMSNRRFKKGTFFPENPFLFSYLAIFAHFFLKTGFLLLDNFFFWIADTS